VILDVTPSSSPSCKAFPSLWEVIRRADTEVKVLIEIEADISRQFHEKGYAELDVELLSPPELGFI
jgi:hypothetical protein